MIEINNTPFQQHEDVSKSQKRQEKIWQEVICSDIFDNTRLFFQN